MSKHTRSDEKECAVDMMRPQYPQPAENTDHLSENLHAAVDALLMTVDMVLETSGSSWEPMDYTKAVPSGNDILDAITNAMVAINRCSDQLCQLIKDEQMIRERLGCPLRERR